MALVLAAKALRRLMYNSQPDVKPASGPNAHEVSDQARGDPLREQHGAAGIAKVTGQLGERQDDRDEQRADREEQPRAQDAGLGNDGSRQREDPGTDHRVDDDQRDARRGNRTY